MVYGRSLALVSGLALVLSWPAVAMAPMTPVHDPLVGQRSPLPKDWIGRYRPDVRVPILVLAGHADSQGIAGSGTSGAAVDLHGHAPMDPRMRDELFWNRLVSRRVEALGRARGLNIRFYEPPLLRIDDPNDPRTNWSVGRRHVQGGGYALEVHFDAYGPDGVGSGLIPRLAPGPNRLDESLATTFGSYPLRFRGGLGGPRRGISLLEVGKLEGELERRLRDPSSRQVVIEGIALRVVRSLAQALDPFGDALSPVFGPLSRLLPADGSGRREMHRSTTPADA